MRSMSKLPSKQSIVEHFLQLKKCLSELKLINESLESRSYSLRIRGQFDHQVSFSTKKIQYLTKALKALTVTDFTKTNSQNIQNHNNNSNNDSNDNQNENKENKPTDDGLEINEQFIKEFKETCLQIEIEWRIGYRHLQKHPSFQNHNRNNTNNSNDTSSNHNSDHDNTQEEIFYPLADSQQDKDLNESIRSINDELQSLLELTTQLQDMAEHQQQQINTITTNVEEAKTNIQQASSTLKSIVTSPITYAVAGGAAAVAIGSPLLIIGFGLKAAIGGSVGLGFLGAFGGSKLAATSNKNNMNMDLNNSNNNNNNNDKTKTETDDKKEDSILDEHEKKPLLISEWMKNRPHKKDKDEDDDIEPWDARN